MNRQAATRIAFTVIVIFVIAQVGWWLLFQTRLVNRNAAERAIAWQRDVQTVNILLSENPDAVLSVVAAYPHLRLIDASVPPRVEIDPAAEATVLEQDRSARRMVAYEGPFFALVILLLLALIAGSLRAERELKRRQQNFLSAVTHEFKTPIGTLRLLTETLQYRDVNRDKARHYLEQIDRELARLERTSNEVLAAARLETQEDAPSLDTRDLRNAVNLTIEQLRHGLEARGVHLDVRYTPDDVPVALNMQAFNLALGNLLENAAKYTPGTVKPVRVTVQRDGSIARIHVDDQGPGVPAEERQHVFDRFYRVGNELTRTASGVGLGLHLARRMIEAMNGWVTVSDAPGGTGARFTLHLPIRIARQAASTPSDPRDEGWAGA